MHIGERSLFLGTSRLLWAFDFEKSLDAEGNEAALDVKDLTEGLSVLSKAFQQNSYREVRQGWSA